MTTRRPQGLGSVFQLADGRWRAQAQNGYLPSGGRRRISVTKRTKAEADAELRKLLRTIAEGKAVSGRKTVRAWAIEWLDIQDTRLRPTAAADYRSKITRWVVPTIGARRLSDLTPADRRAITQAMRTAGRSTTTMAHVQTDLTKMLKDAVAEGHDVPARVLTFEAPANAVNDRDAIPLDDAVALLTVAAGDPDGSRWVAGLLQGMRQAERLGLTWPMVDLAADKLTISWQLKPLAYRHGCGVRPCGNRRPAACPARQFRVPDGYEHRQLYGTLHLVRPKSRAGWRVQPIVPWMRTALLRQLAAQAGRPNPHGLVWPRPDGKPETSHRDTLAWNELQDRTQVARVDGTLGRRYEGHEMRHTAASLLLAMGVDESVRTAILGHSTIASTRAYEHVDLTMARKALEGAAGRLGLN